MEKRDGRKKGQKFTDGKKKQEYTYKKYLDYTTTYFKEILIMSAIDTQKGEIRPLYIYHGHTNK